MTVQTRRLASRKGHRTRARMIAARRAPIERLAAHRATIEARHWRTFLALCRVYVHNGRATIRLVQLSTGHRSPNTTHQHLRALARAGIVEIGTAGALRPLFIPHYPKETTA